MAMDYVKLKAELTADPKHLGYAPLTHPDVGADDDVARLLNAPDTDTCPPAPYTVRALLEAVGAAGVGEIMAAGLLPLLAIAGPTFDLSDPAAAGIMQAMLVGVNPQQPACPHCLSALATFAQPQPCSRAEALFGRNTVITHTQVAIALRDTP